MSTSTGISDEPATQVAPRRVLAPPPETRPGFPWRGWLLGVVAAAVVLGIGGYLHARRKAGLVVRSERTAVVKRGDLVRSLRIHGVVEAVQSYSVAAPRLMGQRGQDYGSLIITRLVAGGTRVKPGDVLVEFDRQNQLKNALDREADYKDYLEQIKKKQADQAAQAAADQTGLRQAENAVRAATLELRRNEVISKIDAEKNQENLDQAKAQLEQLRQTFELKRLARQADLHVLEIQRDRARNAMTYAEKNAEKLVIKSRLAGVVVLNSIWKAGNMAEVQEGDSVDAGRPIMQVVDPGAMQVRARANQADIPFLDAGLPVTIGLDAYPELTFKGKLERIGAIGVTSTLSQRVHTFTAMFSITGSDPRLMPDLSAAVDVELGRHAGKLIVPRDAIIADADKNYVLVKNGTRTDRRLVKLGPATDSEVAVESGLEEGVTVLRNPKI